MLYLIFNIHKNDNYIYNKHIQKILTNLRREKTNFLNFKTYVLCIAILLSLLMMTSIYVNLFYNEIFK